MSGDPVRLIDVEHLGRRRVIGCWQAGDVLVDPGPEGSSPTLLAALGEAIPEAILLTHVHLDHAGSTGALVRRWPGLEVWVHERGAPHLVDPSRLIESASRLYGSEMERLWGEIVPVPEANVRALAGGERVRGFEVAYTPGHASHHVCYLHGDSGRAFVGDVAATRIPPAGLVLPPTPPPDIDIEAWERSLDLVEAWRPASLALTHFGSVEEPGPHLHEVRRRLRELAERAREMDAESFAAALRSEVSASMPPDDAASLLQAVPPGQQWAGLDRYWRRRARP
ncbi:MAG: MBL fold metallo-hydrolase [Solirubrobacterales bacterium]